MPTTEEILSDIGKRLEALEKRTRIFCLSCGKSEFEVKKMFCARNINICNECVDLCNRVADGTTTP
jgi:hypothetical protein